MIQAYWLFTACKAQIDTIITRRFDIGYSGPHFSCIAKNLQSPYQYPKPLCENVMSELMSERMAGPFLVPPLPNFCTSPTGIIPKKDSTKFSTITDLSSHRRKGYP